MLKVVLEIAKIALVAACLYQILGWYVRRERPAWAATLDRRRLSTMLLLLVAVIAAKIGEDVINHESGPIDRSILWFVHAHVPHALLGIFEALTLTGSATILFPLTLIAACALFLTRNRLEAALISGSVLAAALVIYAVKLLVDRDRPELWDTATYWGSSFPSGHTLAVAAFATAAVLCIGRIRPQARRVAAVVAFAWIALVAASRLVLGVHWPTDVLFAACVGAFIPLALRVVLEWRRPGSTKG